MDGDKVIDLSAAITGSVCLAGAVMMWSGYSGGPQIFKVIGPGLAVVSAFIAIVLTLTSLAYGLKNRSFGWIHLLNLAWLILGLLILGPIVFFRYLFPFTF